MSHTTQNAFGALSLAVADRMQEAVDAVASHGASAPAALIALDGFAGGESIDALRRVLAITHSGAVRLVDRLTAAGLVERRVGPDARAVSVHLTQPGRRIARRVRAAREGALEQVLAPLSAGQREQLNALLSVMLRELARDEHGARRVCRLCDREACRACPARALSNRRVEA